MPIIGAHVSVAGGLSNAVKNAQVIGAQALQIFGASPRTFFAKLPDKEEIKKYQAGLKAAKLGPVFLHAAYLVNLASPEAVLRQKSIKSLSDHLSIAKAIGAQGLIFHIGSGKDMPREQALEHTITSMKKVLSNVPGTTQLIMENTAGSGAKIGKDAAELGFILKKVNSARVKVCIDTAHAFEAGAIDEYTPGKIKIWLDDYQKQVGFKNIVTFHVNDSKTLAGSAHDRHANIGAGHIGLAGFKNLAKDKRLKNMPWILEVPGFDNAGPDKKNIDILKKICG